MSRIPFLLLTIVLLLAGCNGAKDVAKPKPVQRNNPLQKTSLSIEDEAKNVKLTLSLALPQREIIAGKPAFASIKLANRGTEDLTLGYTGHMFDVEVTDQSNTVVWSGTRRLPGFGTSVVKGGEAHGARNLFVVDEPGTYKVVATLYARTVKKTGATSYATLAPLEYRTKPITITVKQTQKRSSKQRKPEGFTMVWDGDEKHAWPKMVYNGYTYEHLLAATTPVSLERYTYIGSYMDKHFYRDKGDRRAAPLRIWQGPSPDSKSGSLFLYERSYRAADLQQVEPIRRTKSSSNLQLSIELPKVPHTVGTPYPAVIQLKNTGDKDIELWADKLFDFRIVDERGHTVWEQKQYDTQVHKYTIVKGKTYTVQAQDFYLHKSGTYRIMLRTNDGTPQNNSASVIPFNPPKVTLEPIAIEVAKDPNATNPVLTD